MGKRLRTVGRAAPATHALPSVAQRPSENQNRVRGCATHPTQQARLACPLQGTHIPKPSAGRAAPATHAFPSVAQRPSENQNRVRGCTTHPTQQSRLACPLQGTHIPKPSAGCTAKATHAFHDFQKIRPSENWFSDGLCTDVS
ncbi:hypothetical protein [Kingella potus]|uniref:hypothetical protein n=1 Tax=Kingella potus TaxID=265175 RepID=UPI001FD3BB26|nr:hypothetical protein [Kingella potus]UOP00482.1 hypothetical protein LVJ84_11530 [Kingella potus]